MPTLTMNTTKRDQALNKLKRVEGRVRGLIGMVEEGRDCEDILMQISATQEALRIAGKQFIQNYLEENVMRGLTATNSEKRDDAYEELLGVLYKYIK
ncbi:MAG: metal-sensitive transcriptional regulator [bacterium]|nr:metal-sensitive transcriptional regulator [bacterium]